MSETGHWAGATSGIGMESAHESGTQHSDSRHTIHFERTFCHWVTQANEDGVKQAVIPGTTGIDAWYDTWNDGWRHIPYDFFCTALKRRDWFAINNLFKRWRVKSCGFKMDHIVSTSTEIGTVAGAVAENTTYNEQPYMWNYIDKEYQLPIAEVTNIPNKNMSVPWVKANRDEMTLRNYSGKWADNVELDGDMGIQWMNLLNTNLIGTIKSGETWGYQWHANPNDHKFWRHAVAPFETQQQLMTSKLDAYIYTGARFKTNVAGGLIPFQDDTAVDNIYMQTGIRQYWEKPPPTAIVKVVPLYKKDNSAMNLSFFVQITYNMTIEGQINQMMYYPLDWDWKEDDPDVACMEGVNNIKMIQGPSIGATTVGKKRRREATAEMERKNLEIQQLQTELTLAKSAIRTKDNEIARLSRPSTGRPRQ